MIKHTDYITLYALDNGCIEIEIYDVELFDFIEDVLCEQFDIQSEYVNKQGKRLTAVYPLKYSQDTILKALQSISKDEIERVYKLSQNICS